MNLPHSNNPLAWHHCQFQLPSDWELTGFASREEKGRLEFSTRNGLQAQLYWRRCDRKPDVGRIIDEIHRRHLRARKAEHAQRFGSLQRANPSQFLFGYDRPDWPCHAGAYLEDSRVLLQWLFPNFDQDEAEHTIKPMLASFAPNDGDRRHWAIMGLNFQLPEKLKLISVEPYPANVSLMFEGKRLPRVTVRRWGASPLLLKDKPVKHFIHKYVRSIGSVVSVEERRLFGHPGVEVDFRKRGERVMQKLTGRWWPGKLLAWHDEEAMRIYAFEQVGPKRRKRLELSDVFQETCTPATPA